MKQLPHDHEPHSSIKSTRISKYNAKRSDYYNTKQKLFTIWYVL
ncbi:uncharacterized protein G2W53_004421 [Senna tora]|uniref:Uncharacterized protein n=1 Tax=Senna tora TaxID=362788 RepID=A0A834XAU7_9FABA|nr:uncharacterized protein G2W53_004421 [Senna tora]